MLSPPPLAARAVRVLTPTDRRAALVGVLTDGFHERVRTKGPRDARRWFREEAATHMWPAIRLPVLGVVLASLVHGGLAVPAPWEFDPTGRWVRWARAVWPEAAFLVATAHSAWRARSWTAGLLAGSLASCLVTLATEVAFVGALALGQPRLFWLGLTWASLRDLIDVFVRGVGTGTAVGAVGGLTAHALRWRWPSAGRVLSPPRP